MGIVRRRAALGREVGLAFVGLLSGYFFGVLLISLLAAFVGGNLAAMIFLWGLPYGLIHLAKLAVPFVLSFVLLRRWRAWNAYVASALGATSGGALLGPAVWTCAIGAVAGLQSYLVIRWFDRRAEAALGDAGPLRSLR